MSLTRNRSLRLLLTFRETLDGAAALEFAFIAPFIFLILLFIMWMGYVSVMGQMLDLATQRAARQIATGSVQSSQYSQTQFINNVLCPQLIVMFNCNNLVVNIQAVSTTDASYPSEYYSYVNTARTGLIVPTLNNASTSYCPGNAGGYVYFQVLYPVPVFLPFVTNLAGLSTYNGSTALLLESTITFLNEPFSAPVSPC